MARLSIMPLISSESTLFPFNHSNFKVAFWNVVPGSHSVQFCNILENFPKRLSYANQPGERGQRNILKPISAVRSGMMPNPEIGALGLETAEVVVESRDEDKLKLRVDVAGKDTQKAVNLILKALSGSVPPTPGFRRQKGGKFAKVDIKVFKNLFGEDSLNKFIITEIVTSTVANYLEKENLAVKDNKIKTTQTDAELAANFVPGTVFGFNVELELVKEEAETTSDDS